MALKYDTLDDAKDEIRLIRLLGSRYPHDPIRFDIKAFKVSKAPPYTALSYTWGEPKPTFKIYVEEMSIKIRQNLYNCLFEMRNMGSAQIASQYFWIDQISIDQSNTKERNHQVQLMSQIYANCEYVIVWLGSKDDRPNAGLRVVSEDERTFYDLAKDFSKDPDEKLHRWILWNTYFHRLWVAQEVLLARRVEVLVGDFWISWETLRRPVLSRSVENRPDPLPARNLLKMADGKRSAQSTLKECIESFCLLDCSDPRDKVYGLLGLVRPDMRPTIDYAKKAQEVYLDVVMVFIDAYLAMGKGGWGELMSYGNVLRMLSESMHLDLHYRRTLYEIVHGIFRSDGLERFLGKQSSPISSMGYENATDRHSERWYYDFLGKRYYVRCSRGDIEEFNNMPLCADWDEYLDSGA